MQNVNNGRSTIDNSEGAPQIELIFRIIIVPIDVLICYQIIAVVAPFVCVYISIHVVIRRHSCGLTCVLNMSLQFPHLDGIANTSWVVVLRNVPNRIIN